MRYKFLPFLITAIPFFLFGQAQFVEMADAVGLNQQGKNYGIAIGDFNNDGLDDIFVARQEQPCQLYQNNGNGTFTEMAAEVGLDYVGTAVCPAWADIDNDGWLDLLLTNREEDNLLFRNEGNAQEGQITFTDIAESAGVLEGERVKSAHFADVDMDGFVDIYLARLSMENILYKNNGDLTFTDITDWSNAEDDALSMGAVFFDYDNDGDPDLYLTRDGSLTFILYQNLGNGKFVDVSIQSGTNNSAMGMGVDVADVNNDGWMDIYVTNLYYNSLLINDGNNGFFGPSFTEVAIEAGVGDVGMGWGTCFLDYDNDGRSDIYVANDSYFSPVPNVLYRNIGDIASDEIMFDTVSIDHPLGSMEPSYGVVCTDTNNDGLLDILVSNWQGDIGNQFFQNEEKNNNSWIKIKTIGTESNRAGIGTKVTIENGGIIYSDEVISGSGYASQNSLTLHFGLGQTEIIEKLTLRWPNGLIETYESLPINTTLTFTEGEGFLTSIIAEKKSPDIISVSPNPFIENIKIEFFLPVADEVKLTLLDAQGRVVSIDKLGHLAAGKNEILLNKTELVTGLYFIKIESNDYNGIVKLIRN